MACELCSLPRVLIGCIAELLPLPEGRSAHLHGVFPSMAAERPCSRSDILTCEDLQRELQDFAKEKLPELFETFAKETAKISCEQLKEVLDSMKITRNGRIGTSAPLLFERKPSLKAVPPPLPEGEPLPALPGLVQADAEPAVDEILPAPVSSAAKPAQADGARSSVTSFAQLPDPEEDSKGKEEQESRTPDARRRHQNSKDNGWDALAQRVQQTDTVKEVLQQEVYAWPMEYLTLTVILINALCLGLETNIMAANLSATTPEEFIGLGWAFCAFFTLEMFLKISANPSRFFLGTAWQLNLLDFFLMALQWLDEPWTDMVVVTISTADDGNSVNLNIMRAIRMVRSYRVLRMLGEVRAIIWSVSTSFKPLLGALLVLMTLIYLLAVFLVDTCNYYRVDTGISDAGFEQLGTYYGSLAQGMLTLWQIITGGMDWANAVKPLIDHTGAQAVFVVFCYIAFTQLALLNVITGVCVESAVKRGKEDKDTYLVQYVRSVFKRMESSSSGIITWDDFQASLNSRDMKELFKAIDLDISEAHCVFKILDLDDDGTLDADEFLSGAMPLQLKVHHLGKKRSLAVRETDPIDAVKLSVQRLLGFRPAAVLIDGMDLTEGKTLADYNADAASVITVTRRKAKAADEAPGKGPAAEEDDVTIVTPPRKAARPSRRRPLTTMDVDAKALAEAQRLRLEGPFMEVAGSLEVVASGLLPKKAADAQTLLQSLNMCNGCAQEARQLIAELHVAVS
ncbi:CACNA1S [Symbiodinium pilosum]|uniref:CACNA1S protein n=1 Tax=Symbiodinium pilosum TaxID=2952 RepID=A0A812KQZ1_SYMPI|nr:CACNA1S [Symbiodinium pilosum]